MEISWCSASAVRFIGTQRPSCTIDQEVSTHSATAARVRCSVSMISTSATSSRRSSPPARRSWALSRVRGTFQDSVSPNAHGRVAPVGLPGGAGAAGLALPAAAADPVDDVPQRRLPQPAQRLGRQPQRAVRGPLEQRPAAQLALQLGQRAGVHPGLVAELRRQRVQVDVVQPGARIALRQLLGQRVELPELLHAPGWPRPCPAALSPRNRPRPVPVLAGPQALQLGVQLAQRLGQPRVAEGLLADSSTSSARCSALIELSIRCAAAARCASRSISSSVVRGFSGKNSPCLAMNWSNCAVVSCPAACVGEQLR